VPATRAVTVALDGYGAEQGFDVLAEGARRAAADPQIGIRVFGPRRALGLDGAEGIEVLDTNDWIANEEDPVSAVRVKKDASVVRAAADVAAERSAAFVSPGSTGATMAAATFGLRRLQGVQRPALAVQLPAPGKTVLFLDVGANVNVRAQHLVQFAFLGAAFSAAVLGVERPRVGLLTVGEESGKGRDEVVEANRLLSEAPGIDFAGNVEGGDLPAAVADVVVTDGFTGNVVLKTLEPARGRRRPLDETGAGRAAARLPPRHHRRRNPARAAGDRRCRPRLGRGGGDRQRGAARRPLRRGRRGRPHRGAAARGRRQPRRSRRERRAARRRGRNAVAGGVIVMAMKEDEVLTLVREHLAEELEVDVGRISAGTRFREDLDADSLDLYELVMELEDRYGVAISEEQATHINTVGDAVGFVLEHAPA